MKKLTLTLAAAALALGSMVLSASAQRLGAGHALVQNATPIVKHVACGGFGPCCGPGFARACGPYGAAGAGPASDGRPRQQYRSDAGRLGRPRCFRQTAGIQFSGRPVK